jgi:uncharacterized Tic20 family protein
VNSVLRASRRRDTKALNQLPAAPNFAISIAIITIVMVVIIAIAIIAIIAITIHTAHAIASTVIVAGVQGAVAGVGAD